ncbi:MAG TPA: aldehyde dehydrogenase family protein [Sphingobium sp.]
MGQAADASAADVETAIVAARIASDLPFGGYKASGIGREWDVGGIEEFLESKVIAIGVPA